MHFTASGSLQGTVDWFKNLNSSVSAHLVIGRDGEIVQMVPFNVQAWHAGKSEWGKYRSLNNHSIGIELVNWGQLKRSVTGLNWVSWTNKQVPNDDIHLNDFRAWQRYTKEQMVAAVEACQAICEAYVIQDILGHSDIAPGRKTDPGPAFPMEVY